MNITFLIGNGFDINLGLKTRYSDFYPYFQENASQDNIILEWLKEDEMNWADLEKELGIALTNLSPENINKFIQDKFELEELLLDYLEMQQSNSIFLNINKEYCIKEFNRSITSIFTELPEENQQKITNTKKQYYNEEFLYKFVNFNYTKTLSDFFKNSYDSNPILSTHLNSHGQIKNEKLSQLLHVHGTLNENMILGVNDISQIHNEQLKNDLLLQEQMIKSSLNKNIGAGMIPKAKEIITNSKIICIYGMSIGDTDKMWWEEIVNWLKLSTYNQLVLCIRKDQKYFKRNLPGRKILLVNEAKDLILEKGKGSLTSDTLNRLKEQIHVLHNPSIFKFNQPND